MASPDAAREPPADAAGTAAQRMADRLTRLGGPVRRRVAEGLRELGAVDRDDPFGDHVTAARSQPYYLDVTHPEANKGAVARYLSATYTIPAEAIATIGDMPNDVLMFAHSGLSSAMGNASPEVQRTARRVTASNADEGFASAVERFILPG